MKALVVGLGHMGMFHARILTDLGHDVTTVDPAGHADHTRTPREHYEIACIATPIWTLARMAAVAALQARPTYMLIEKPYASSLDQHRRYTPVLHAVPHIGVGYVERHNPIVQQLITENKGSRAQCIEFTRLNDKPTPDAKLDLWSHDLDLATYLGSQGVGYTGARFTAEGGREKRQRTITVHTQADTHVYDLTAHTDNPLRHQWQDLLEHGGTTATIHDAIRTLETIENTHLTNAA